MDARHTMYTPTGDSAAHTMYTRMEHRDDESKSDSVVVTADGERNNTAIVFIDLLKFIEILPSGGFSGKNVFYILTMLDIKSLGAFINTSFLKLFCRRTQNDYILLRRRCKEIQYPYKLQFFEKLKEQYRKEFPRGTPLVCACEKGRVEDVEGMIRGARAAGMDVTAMVSEVGTNSWGGNSWTPLMMAAENEHSTIIEILLQYNADTATTNYYGDNALHCAAYHNKTTTTTVQLLLNNMKLEDINHKNTWGNTPLDGCYKYNNSSIKQQLIDLIRQKGGKRASEL